MIDYYKTKEKYYRYFDILANFLPELIAIKGDLRKATEINISDKNKFNKKYLFIKNFCIKLNLYLDSYLGIRGNKLVISNEKLPSIIGNESENKDNRFSYPLCCIEKFKEKSQYHFINNIKELLEKNKKFNFKMNFFLRNTPFHLFKHLPCSLNCIKTLDYTHRLLKIIKSENKLLYFNIVYFNRTPVFYTDICSIGISFIGKLVANKINFKNFYFEGSPNDLLKKTIYNTEADCILFNEIIQALARGNELIFENNELIIKKDNKTIQNFKKPTHLYWKIINFIK